MKSYRYKYLFGPVPSRRLGISLGVDLVPYKTCSLNCVYCESGRTTNSTFERKEYVPTKAVLSELNDYLKSKPKLDYITFSGSGEPALHSKIGRIIKYLKGHYSSYKLALLTNGTLFYLPRLREDVKTVDLILPSLDAASDAMFQKLNRPVRGLKIGQIINGLVELREIFPGKLWLEIFIVPGLNDTEEQLGLLREAIHRIRPDRVQLNTLDRPGTETWVQPANENILRNIAARLEWPTQIIASFQKRELIASYNMDVESTILQTIKRRPCTVDDLSSTLGLHPNEINKYLETLLEREQIGTELLERGVFFKLVDND